VAQPAAALVAVGDRPRSGGARGEIKVEVEVGLRNGLVHRRGRAPRDACTWMNSSWLAFETSAGVFDQAERVALGIRHDHHDPLAWVVVAFARPRAAKVHHGLHS